MNRSGLASLCLLGSLATSTLALAQNVPPPPPPPPAAEPPAPAAPPASGAGASAEGNIDLGFGASGANGAAATLGLKRTTLQARMKKLGITKESRYRQG